MNRILLGLILIISLFQLTGCAQNAASSQMTVMKSPVSHKPRNTSLIDNITVKNVSGGSETNPLWVSKVNDSSFKEAIEKSLMNTGLYKEAGGKYNLNVTLVSLEQPYFGLDLKVVCRARYKLQDTISNKIVFDKEILSNYTATVSDSVIAINRLKMANEGAVRNNISDFIKALHSMPAG